MNIKIAAAAAVVIVAAIGVLWLAKYSNQAETMPPEPTPAAEARRPEPGTVIEPAMPVESGGDAAIQPDPIGERHLLGVFRTEPKERSRAFIRVGEATGSYAVGDKLPPDDAVLTQIEERYVLLQASSGAQSRLLLEGNGVAPARPEQDPDEDEDEDEEDEDPPDPYASCEQFDDADEQVACEERIDEELERLEAACDEVEDPEAWELCLDSARRLAPKNTAGRGATPPPAE